MGENERGAERTEMGGKAETDRVGEASGGRWMDRLREFIALDLKINRHLTLAFLFFRSFSISSSTAATTHAAGLVTREEFSL